MVGGEWQMSPDEAYYLADRMGAVLTDRARFSFEVVETGDTACVKITETRPDGVSHEHTFHTMLAARFYFYLVFQSLTRR